jgi:hypothetical protein
MKKFETHVDSLVKRNRFNARKASVIGASIGALFTIGVYLWAVMIPSKTLFNFSGYVILQTLEPTVLIAKAFGKNMHWFANDSTGGPAIFPAFLVVITNSILGFVFGAIIGKLIKFRNNKKGHIL